LRGLAAALAVATGVAVLAGTQLAGAIDQRPAPATAAPAGRGQASAARADVRAAADRVRKAPSAPGAHVALAGAYAEAGRDRLATIEYLAATSLDPGNPEANTALALTAFTSGDARTAKSLVDRALRAEPRYPEALYTRGLVLAMGLHRPRVAARDFHAYLDAAPFGSHRTNVETLLALLDGGDR
jgi:Tfp pilus assembly protein PilF